MADDVFRLQPTKPARPRFVAEVIEATTRTHQRPLFIGADDLAGQAYLFDPIPARESEKPAKNA